MMKKIWIILVILTTFAFLLGYFKFTSPTLIAVLLLSTFIKGQLVIDHFMGLKDVSLKYRLIPTIWLFIVLSLISIAYYLPASL